MSQVGGDQITPSACQTCGKSGPVRHVKFQQNIGVILLRFPSSIEGWLCKACISKYFWKMTGISLVFGWWGLISFFYTLVAIPSNVATFLGARDLPDA